MEPSRLIRKKLTGPGAGSRHPFATLDRHFTAAQESVRIFYLLSVIFAGNAMLGLHGAVRGLDELDFSWPVRWISGGDLMMWADIFSTSALLLALWCVIDPRSSLARIGFALSLLFCGGVATSFGGVNHGFHAWLWIAAAFAFLPTGQSRAGKLSYCVTFASAQALLLGFYSLAGTWKLVEGVGSLLRGTEGNFSPSGLAYVFADRMAQTGTTPLLGKWFVEHWWLSLPMFVAVIYAQFVAIAITYRPRLHLAWGVILIGFHVGTFLFMEIIFVVNVLAILPLLICSPFQVRPWLRWDTLADLPLLGRLFRGRFVAARQPVPA